MLAHIPTLNIPQIMAAFGMISERYPDLLALSDEDKLQLAGELWKDVVGGVAEEDPALAALIAARLAEYQAHPEQVSSWTDVKARLLALRR